MIYKQFLLFAFFCLVGGVAKVSANTLEGVRVWPSPEETRIVMDLSSEAIYSYFTLTSPNRLVVDLKNTNAKSKLPITIKDSIALKKIRQSSPPDKGTYRLVFELKKQTTPNLFKLNPTPGGQYGHRLVIDLPHGATSKTVETQSSNQSAPLQSPVNKDASQFLGNADVIVAIDPGHGGEDPGSIGPTKKYEKHATLTISKKLARELNQVRGIRAVLTRSGDYFVNLNKRSEIARKNKAHLLVSVHADSFRSAQPRGGSVFVLNVRRANSEIARWVEKHEEQSELLGGAGEVLSKHSNDRNLSQTLLDLKFSHSQKEGYKVAKNILKEMGKVIRLHKKEPVHASLAVLKSPDIPSVLVETGFISNPTEEKLLFQRVHQDKLAQSLSKAIVDYFESNPPEGTWFANKGATIKHKVASGESLSRIAQKYGTTIQSIVATNTLKSTKIGVGQVLLIATAASSPPPVTTQIITHEVKAGEYLGKIANKYKVSVASIKQRNQLKSNTLKVGQKLKVQVKLKDNPVVKHKVKKGEYLGKIAAQYGVSTSAIKRVNHLKSDTLSVGQVLMIPSK